MSPKGDFENFDKQVHHGKGVQFCAPNSVIQSFHFPPTENETNNEHFKLSVIFLCFIGTTTAPPKGTQILSSLHVGAVTFLSPVGMFFQGSVVT